MKTTIELRDLHHLTILIRKIPMILTHMNYDGKLLRDTGLVGELWFDIVDGKKVYKKWAGVNQPMEIL